MSARLTSNDITAILGVLSDMVKEARANKAALEARLLDVGNAVGITRESFAAQLKELNDRLDDVGGCLVDVCDSITALERKQAALEMTVSGIPASVSASVAASDNSFTSDGSPRIKKPRTESATPAGRGSNWGGSRNPRWRATSDFTTEERVLILDMVKQLKGPESKLSDEAVLRTYIHPMNPEYYGNITRQILAYWATQIKNAVKKVEDIVSSAYVPTALDRDIMLTLDELKQAKLLGSISLAFHICMSQPYAKAAREAKDGPQVSRSRVAKLMQRLNLQKTPITRSSVISSADAANLTAAFTHEVISVCEEYYVPDELWFNMDETSYRICPEIKGSWGRRNEPPEGKAAVYEKIFKRFPYTTLLCCISATGEFLPPQINWKGKSDAKLKIGGFRVMEYVQWTHWSTTESILHYCKIVLLPRVATVAPDARERKPRFVLLLDYAGVHIGAEFRKRFQEEFADTGILMFIPPNLTSSLQPLDVAVFGVFKPLANQHHTFSLVKGVLQHIWEKSPQAFEFSTKQARQACLAAIEAGWIDTAAAMNKPSGKEKLTKAWDNVLALRTLDAVRRPAAIASALNAVAADTADRQARGFRRPRKTDTRFITFPFGHPVRDLVGQAEEVLTREDLVEVGDEGPKELANCPEESDVDVEADVVGGIPVDETKSFAPRNAPQPLELE